MKAQNVITVYYISKVEARFNIGSYQAFEKPCLTTLPVIKYRALGRIEKILYKYSRYENKKKYRAQARL